jgi:site-specific DNA-cytosine methylase
MEKINVLSLFDGLGCARIALDQLGIDCNYYASEIDTHCVEVHQHNYPDTTQLGDVEKVDGRKLPKIDLLIGGSPCQSLSGLVNLTDKTKGFAGKSKLFFEYIRILQEVKPKYFLLENVASMKDRDRDIMSELIGVKPIMIDSRLVTGQARKRYYWTNIPGVTQPEDLGIKLQEVLESGYTEKEKSYCLTATYFNACPQNYFIKSERQHKFLRPVQKIGHTFHIGDDTKIEIIASKGADLNRPALHEIKHHTSMLSPVECERLQGIPDGYTEIAKKKERYKMIGNSFTVPVIKHILSFMKFEE